MANTLKVTPRYLNTYEAARSRYKGTSFYDADVWNTMAKRGQLGQYINTLSEAEGKVNYDSYKEYNPEYLNTDEKLLALGTELYMDKENPITKTRSKIDENGNIFEEEYQTTEYEYNKTLLQNIANERYQTEQLKLAQEEKDNLSTALKILGTVSATAGEFSVAAGKQVENIFTIPEAILDGTIEAVKGGKFGEGFRKAYNDEDLNLFTNLEENLADFESKYTYMRKLDGSYETVGKVLGTTATSFGQAMPTMLLQRTGLGQNKVASKIINALYWTGMGSNNFRELSSEMTSIPTWQLVTNAAAKATAEWAISAVNAKVFGASQLDKLLFNYTAKEATVAGIKGVFYDALKEGTEEVLQEYSGYIIDKFFAATSNYGEEFDKRASWTFETLVDSFILGALSSIIGSSIEIVTENICNPMKNPATGKKLNMFAAWKYKQDITQAISEGQIKIKDNNLSKEQKTQLEGQLAVTSQQAADYIAIIGEDRTHNALKFIEQLEQMGKTIPADIKSQQELNQANAQKVVDITKDSTINVVEALSVYEVGSVDNIVYDTDDVSEIEEKVGNKKGIETVQFLQRQLHLPIVITGQGMPAITNEYVYVPKNLLQKQNGAVIFNTLQEQQLINIYASELSSITKASPVTAYEAKTFLQNLTSLYKKIYNKEGSVEVSLREFLFNPTFYKTAIYNSTADTLKFYRYALSTLANNSLQYKAQKIISEHIDTMCQFAKDCQFVSIADIEALNSLNLPNIKEKVKEVRKERYTKDIAAGIIRTYAAKEIEAPANLSEDQVKIVATTIKNASTLSLTEKIVYTAIFTANNNLNIDIDESFKLLGITETDNIKKATYSTSNKDDYLTLLNKFAGVITGIERGNKPSYKNINKIKLNILFRLDYFNQNYKTKFYSALNGITYPKLDYEANQDIAIINFYNFLKENNLTIPNLKNMQPNEFNKVAEQFTNYTNNQYTLQKVQDNFKIVIKPFAYPIDAKTLASEFRTGYAREKGSYKGKEVLFNSQGGLINTFKKISKTQDTLGKYLDSALPTNFVNSLSTNDIITNPQYLSKNTKEAILKYGKEVLKLENPQLNSYLTYSYLRSEITSDTTKLRDIIIDNNNNFVAIDLTRGLNIFKNPDQDSMKEFLKKLVANDNKEPILLSDIVKPTYLIGRLAETKIIIEKHTLADYTYNARYNTETNTLTVPVVITSDGKIANSKNTTLGMVLSGHKLRVDLLHEITHAMQRENDFVNGHTIDFDKQWPLLSVNEQNKLLKEFSEHIPGFDDIDSSVDMGENKSGLNPKVFFISKFLYYQAGELGANGEYGNYFGQVMPVRRITHLHSTEYILPWGTHLQINSGEGKALNIAYSIDPTSDNLLVNEEFNSYNRSIRATEVDSKKVEQFKSLVDKDIKSKTTYEIGDKTTNNPFEKIAYDYNQGKLIDNDLVFEVYSKVDDSIQNNMLHLLYNQLNLSVDYNTFLQMDIPYVRIKGNNKNDISAIMMYSQYNKSYIDNQINTFGSNNIKTYYIGTIKPIDLLSVIDTTNNQLSALVPTALINSSIETEYTVLLTTNSDNTISINESTNIKNESIDARLYEAYIAKQGKNVPSDLQSIFDERVNNVLPGIITNLRQYFSGEQLVSEAQRIAQEYVLQEINNPDYQANPDGEQPDIPIVEEKVPKQITKIGTRRFVSKEQAQGTNLEYWFKKNNKGKQLFMNTDLQNFIVEADPVLLEPTIWNKIGGDKAGTLKTRDLYMAIRHQNLDDYTFNLINKYFFKNSAIKTQQDLNKLISSELTPGDYFAAKVIAEENNLATADELDSLTYLKGDKEIPLTIDKLISVIKLLKDNPLYSKSFETIKERYDNYRGYYALDIDYENLKYLFMKYFDGSFASAERAVMYARNLAVRHWAIPQENYDVIGSDSYTSLESDLSSGKSFASIVADTNTLTPEEALLQKEERSSQDARISDMSFKQKIDHYLLGQMELGLMDLSKAEDYYNKRAELISQYKNKESDLDKLLLGTIDAMDSPDDVGQAEFIKLTEQYVNRNIVPVKSKIANAKKLTREIFGLTDDEFKVVTPLMRKHILKEHSDLFTDDFKLRQELYTTKETWYEPGKEGQTIEKTRFVPKSDEEIETLRTKLREIKYDVIAGKYGTRKDVQAYNKLQKELNRYEKKYSKLAKQAAKLESEKIVYKVKLANSDTDIYIDNDLDMPDVLKAILGTSFDKLRDSKNKAWEYLSDFRNEIDETAAKNISFEATKFIRENSQRLSTLTQSEVNDIVDYFRRTNLASQVMNTQDVSMYLSFKKLLLGYIAKGAKSNLWLLSPEDATYIQTEIAQSGSEAARQLSLHSIVMKMLEPEKVLAESIAYSSELGTSDEWLPYAKRIIEKTTGNDYNGLQEVINEAKDFGLKKYAYLYKDSPSKWANKALALQRAFMLSSPGTWVRNYVSNILVEGTNSIAERANKVINKIWSKHIEGQYRLDAKFNYNKDVKLDNVTASFIKQYIVDSGIYEMTSANLNKYNIDKLGKEVESSDAISDMIVRNIKIEIMQSTQLSPNSEFILNKLLVGLAKVMNDDPWIKKRTLTVMGKLLIENNVDLSQGLSLDAIKAYTEAYSLAAAEYMHKTNIFTDFERAIETRLGTAGYVVWKQIFPFATSSMNWFNEAIRLTPVGLVKSIVEYAKLENTIAKVQAQAEKGAVDANYRFTEYITKRNIGKGVIGSIGTLVGIMLGALGVAKLDDDDETIKIKVGDVASLDISNIFGSSGILMGLAMGYVLVNKDGAFNALKTVLSTMFQDNVIAELYNSFRYNDTIWDWLLSATNNSLSMMIPNFVKTFNQMLYTHKIQYSSGIQKQFERLAVMGIPGAAYLMPRKVDPYSGEIQNEYPGFGGWLLKLGSKLTPLNIKPYNVSDTEKIATSLGIKKGNLKGNFTINDKQIQINSKEVYALNMFYGKLNDKLLKEFINNKVAYSVENEKGQRVKLKYSKMTNMQKATVIKRIMSDNSSLAKIYVLTNSGRCKYYATESEYKTLKSLGLKKNIYLKTNKLKGYIPLN